MEQPRRAKGRHPRAWAGERKPRRPPARCRHDPCPRFIDLPSIRKGATIGRQAGRQAGRRSGYPFSSPRSRCTGLACNRQLINAVFGPPTLWQARMGPAPGHPNHLPSGGYGVAGAARLFAICQELLRLSRCAPPCSSRWAVGFAGAGPIRGCPHCALPDTVLMEQPRRAKGRHPRAWAGERKPRRPPARGRRTSVQGLQSPAQGHQTKSADASPTSLAVRETRHCLVGWTGPALGCGGKTGSGPGRRPRQTRLLHRFVPAATPPV